MDLLLFIIHYVLPGLHHSLLYPYSFYNYCNTYLMLAELALAGLAKARAYPAIKLQREDLDYSS